MVLAQHDTGFTIGVAIAKAIHDAASTQQRGGNAWQKLLIDLRFHRSVQGIEPGIDHGGFRFWERLLEFQSRYEQTARSTPRRPSIHRPTAMERKCG
ncbi:hypothetical protein [Variovorax sp. dw_954]|uniref:hypothetical protein n=1 Tax=Variovorax sp. dw_954 TaxID=2720078 RepID=UPI002115E787|nr:hypothetical protein [Variovorax sp. dw_954]